MTDPGTNHHAQSTKRQQMLDQPRSNIPGKHTVTVEDVQRVLEIGRLLFSVLTEEEIKELQRLLTGSSEDPEIGNDGVT